MFKMCHVEKYKITFKLFIIQGEFLATWLIDDRSWCRAGDRRLIKSVLKYTIIGDIEGRIVTMGRYEQEYCN